MRPASRTLLALGLFTAFAVVAAEPSSCPAQAPGNSVVPPAGQSGTKCPAPQPPCEQKEDVGVVSWILGTHRMPTLHFIDFVEIFLR